MFRDLYVSSLRKELDEMSADAGIVIGFSIYVPFEGDEVEQFFDLCDRFESVSREVFRTQGLLPCPQVLTVEDRCRDSAALQALQDTALLKLDRLSQEARAFRKRVFERFKASKA